ncbi:MAG: GSU2403 family nucleotidyltransferase fold protein [Collinsella sp.]
MNEQQGAFCRILDLIEDAGCMRHVILVGSWAEFVYRESGLIEGFAPNIRTLDVDFLIRNLRKPTPAANLSTMARERGYLVESDILNGTTRLFDTTGLEVEFLIGKVGAELNLPLKPMWGVTAQTLRHMNILSGNSIELPCFEHMVRVPLPEAYAVHKMVINSQRRGKREKDRRAVLQIWPYLDKKRVSVVMAGLTRKENARVKEFMAANDLELDE